MPSADDSGLVWADYQQHWNADSWYFMNKQAATIFADALAPALGLSRKSLIVEGKRKEFHVYIAYVSYYWMPPQDKWAEEYIKVEKLVKEAMK